MKHMADDIKITTGQGAGPDVSIPQKPEPPTNLPSQPDFISPDGMNPTPIPAGVERDSGAIRKILMIFLALVFITGIGALGYFVIYPLVFPAAGPTTNPPVVTLPNGNLAPHSSYLTSAPSAVTEVKLSDVNYPTIAGALQNESFNQLADGQYKEVRISNTRGQVSFTAYLGGLSPAAQALALGDWLENDFTALLYYDPAGVWPVYIAKLKTGVTPGVVMTGFQAAEGVLDLASFYVSSPGAFTSFKDGKVNSYSTRYNVASGAGAAFNYGVMGNYLIISTNYNALKGVLPMLGL